MTRVSEMAEISARGLDPNDPDSIVARAFLVWNAARGNVSRIERVVGPRGGVLYHGNLTSVILDLWPHLSHTDKAEELDRFRKEVYGFLRATNNAVNEKRGTHGGDVVWWLTDTWVPPTGPVVLKVTAATAATHKPTATERKLTPKEAGEDRPPAPVTVTRVVTTTTTETEDTYMTTAAVAEPKLTVAQQQAAKHQQILECIELTLSKAHPQPLTVGEIAADLGIHESTARMALIELAKTGQVFSRTETASERALRFGGNSTPSLRATLYSTDSSVPERTEREAVRGVVATAAPRHPRSGRLNDAAVLAATRTGRWDRAVDIIGRAGIPQGSSTSVFKRLIDSGAIVTKMGDRNGQQVRLYKRVSESRPESPPVAIVAAPPVGPFVGDARSRAIEAVEALLAQTGDSAEVTRLTTELAAANARIAELEQALAPLQALLGRS